MKIIADPCCHITTEKTYFVCQYKVQAVVIATILNHSVTARYFRK